MSQHFHQTNMSDNLEWTKLNKQDPRWPDHILNVDNIITVTNLLYLGSRYFGQEGK